MQYFGNIEWDIPILCGISILYYIAKKWQSRITAEDNYQHMINKKNNTTQSIINSITYFDSNSITTINYDIAYKNLEEYNKDYNKLSANKIDVVNLFINKDDFINCKKYHYKVLFDIDNKKFLFKNKSRTYWRLQYG